MLLLGLEPNPFPSYLYFKKYKYEGERSTS